MSTNTGEKMARYRCDHCGLAFDADQFIVEELDGQTRRFCCQGCRGVYHLLKETNLDRFYQLKGDQPLSPPTEGSNADLARFDSESFTRQFVREKEGFFEVSLVLEKIHCAACVWLNEKVLEKLDGVIESPINFTTHKAKIRFDPKKIKLSQIVQTIRSIGYDAAAYDPAAAEERADAARREYYTRLIVAVFATMNVMWLAISRYLGHFTGMDADLRTVIHFAEFLLATVTLFFSGWVFFRGAYYGLKNRFVTMDLLVSSGATLTWGYSIYAAFWLHIDAYFDSVVMIVTFVLVGKFLEVRAKKSAVDTLDTLIATAPTEVTRLDESGKAAIVSPEEVVVGDRLRIAPGERIVFDGEILSGEASLDTASLTGESEPRSVSPGDRVLGGVLNIDGVLQMRVERDYESSTFKSIITLLEESLAKRPKIEQLANRLSRYFSSTVLTLALLTFAIWMIGMQAGFDRSLMVAVSVIIIACPCALALATPIATVVGVGTAARRGILFKATAHIESMAQARWLLIDKTGTLTTGAPVVAQAKMEPGFDAARLLGLISGSDHPVARGVAAHLSEQGHQAAAIDSVRNRPGLGLSGQHGDRTLLGGNAELMRQNGIALPGDEQARGSRFYFAEDGVLLGYFTLTDRLREGAKEAIAEIKTLGIAPVMLTGDHHSEAEAIAQSVGIETIHADLLPQDKAQIVADYRARQSGGVVMVGDGINDAVALARADIAIAMHSGADVAIDVSDVVLLHDSPGDLLTAFKLSRRTYGFVKQNLALSMVYNALTIPAAMLGLVIPLIAALSMSLSSLLVVGNSFRIRRF
jgi:Cu+-exporting ATPase